jgi:glutamyl-tRNA(Gln) amidotransferase subunit E
MTRVSADQTNKEHGVRPPGDLNPRRDPALDFPDRPFGALTRQDYDTLGFMSGLEVHQQLLTNSKLFCRCPAGRRVTSIDAEVLRHMRPTLSELGEYDGTALMEFKTRKEIVYLLERRSVCTYEIDDTPPFEIDEEAVATAIELALLFDLNLVSELHVMRKQYLDGSIPTGFQRTAMVGLAGTIPFRVPELGVDRVLRIRQLSLEEDSCREVSDVGHRITFRTDRLGMPLTEAVTEPDLVTPLELQAGARLIARVARATGKVRRGAGAARQDVNVSVAGGRRVEIKGVHYHRRLPLLVHVEAFRQLNLLRIRAALVDRTLDPSVLASPDQGLPWETSDLAADMGGVLRNTTHAPLREAITRGETAVAIKLPGFAGLLAHPTQPGRDFAHELAERVRVIACPVDPHFFADSDHRGPGPSEREWREVRRELRAAAEDAVVLVWVPRDDADTAAREVVLRAREAFDGVPAETRQANRDGTTGFERVLPGPDRMYPDTDTPPLPIADRVVAEIRDHLPETPWARADRYVALGLSTRTAQQLAGAPWADLFDAVAPSGTAVAERVATAIAQRLPKHRRSGVPPEVHTAQRVAPLVRALESGAIRLEATGRVLDALAAAPTANVESILDRYRAGPDDASRFELALASVAESAQRMDGRSPGTLVRWGMGELMPAFLGRLDPTLVQDRLTAALSALASEGTR